MLPPALLSTVAGDSAPAGRCGCRDNECVDCMDGKRQPRRPFGRVGCGRGQVRSRYRKTVCRQLGKVVSGGGGRGILVFVILKLPIQVYLAPLAPKTAGPGGSRVSASANQRGYGAERE
jgi:hypothetical protein